LDFPGGGVWRVDLDPQQTASENFQRVVLADHRFGSGLRRRIGC
tara:strand:+ start:427 stop:558 length:132 start_codon:yes stop_codon:yes gene_type:complete